MGDAFPQFRFMVEAEYRSKQDSQASQVGAQRFERGAAIVGLVRRGNGMQVHADRVQRAVLPQLVRKPNARTLPLRIGLYRVFASTGYLTQMRLQETDCEPRSHPTNHRKHGNFHSLDEHALQ